MYCGRNLIKHTRKLASAMIISKRETKGSKGYDKLSPFPSEFIDFSNPDPASDRSGEIKGAVALADELASAGATSWKVWKVTGVSKFDVAGHEVSFEIVVILKDITTCIKTVILLHVDKFNV